MPFALVVLFDGAVSMETFLHRQELRTTIGKENRRQIPEEEKEREI